VTNEEKIRLVLETLGADSVRQAARAMRELEKSTKDAGEAAEKATGKPGANGTGILQLAYFIDDLQYGIRGVMNNIPGLIQSLGLGAGLAGVAGVAAVAVGVLVEKHPEWMKWNEKVKLSLAELIDAIKAEEEAVKRQKEEVEKLGKSNSDRIEDLTKLKIATEDLKAAEDQLAEDRKNRKAFEDAEKNVGAADKDELGRRKGAFKDLVSDAGGEKDLRDQISNAVAGSMPDFQITAEHRKQARAEVIEEAGADFMNMTAGEIEQHTERKLKSPKFLQKVRGQFGLARDREIRAATESIFGGLAAPGSVAESDAALAQLGQFAPDQAAALQGLMGFDRDAAAFEAGNEAWRNGGRQRRRAFERGIDRGMGFGPNREMFEAEQNRQLWQGRQKTEAELTQEAEIRNAALAQFDPTQMAALRNAQAGMGGMRNRNLAGLRQRDMALFQNALVQRGMTPGSAEQAARESLSGGEQQFEQFSQDIGKNLGNGLRAQEATVEYFKMLNIRMEEYAQQMNMLMQQMNMMGGTDIRPQQNRARN
jgi:hypothetical protein